MIRPYPLDGGNPRLRDTRRYWRYPETHFPGFDGGPCPARISETDVSDAPASTYTAEGAGHADAGVLSVQMPSDEGMGSAAAYARQLVGLQRHVPTAKMHRKQRMRTSEPAAGASLDNKRRKPEPSWAQQAPRPWTTLDCRQSPLQGSGHTSMHRKVPAGTETDMDMDMDMDTAAVDAAVVDAVDAAVDAVVDAAVVDAVVDAVDAVAGHGTGTDTTCSMATGPETGLRRHPRQMRRTEALGTSLRCRWAGHTGAKSLTGR